MVASGVEGHQGVPAAALIAARRRHRDLLLRRACVHDCELQEVADRLFIGSLGGVITPGALEGNGVSHVLCVSTGIKEEILKSKAPNASISLERLDDSAKDPAALLEALPMLLSFLNTVIGDGHSILVCSFRGISRAAAVMIAHLMVAYGHSLRTAAAHVASVRDGAAPNPGFAAALLALEAALLAESAVNGGSVLVGLNFDECGAKILEVVQVALSALPDIMGNGPLPRSLPLVNGRELRLPEGLCDLSLQTLEEEVRILDAASAAEQERTGSCSAQGTVAASQADTCAEASKNGDGDDPRVSERMPEDENDIAVLEAKKAEAVASNDFSEAGRLRDLIRGLRKAADTEPQIRQNHQDEAQPSREELLAKKKAAVEREDWAEAAQLRDTLRHLDNLEPFELDVDSLAGAKSSLESQLAEVKANLRQCFQEESVGSAKRPPEALVEAKEAMTLSQRCSTYPMASLAIALLALMCLHAGVLHGLPQETSQDL